MAFIDNTEVSFSAYGGKTAHDSYAVAGQTIAKFSVSATELKVEFLAKDRLATWNLNLADFDSTRKYRFKIPGNLSISTDLIVEFEVDKISKTLKNVNVISLPRLATSGNMYPLQTTTENSVSFAAPNNFSYYVGSAIEVFVNLFVTAIILNREPTNTTIPSLSAQPGNNKTVNLSTYFSDADGDTLTYTASSSNTSVGTVAVSGSTLTLTPKSLGSTTITVTASDGKGGTKSTTFTFNVVNNAPTVSVTSPTTNQTLHENSTLTIAGSATDADIDNVVTVKYQIDSGAVRNLHSAISNGSTSINFSRALTFKEGVLKDGTNAITSVLDKDTPHTVSIWAEDDKGGKSSIVTRTFFVVPNRPPTLTINPIAAQTELINSNVINVSGNVVDPDNNDVTVTFAINGGEEQTIIDNGPATSFAFNILLNNLRVGANTVVIKAVDSYQSQTAKTLTINKTHNATSVNEAVALYKISTPTGSAKSILLWITRTLGPLQITPEISFVNDGEAENFAPLQLTNTGTVNGLKQDEYAYQGSEDKTNIVLKITYNRIDAASLDAIKQISGVLF